MPSELNGTGRGPLPSISGNMRVYLCGKTRSGKSYYARYTLKLAREAGWRIVIIDPKRDWMGRPPDRRPYGQLTKDFRGSVDQPILITTFDPTIAVSIIEPFEWDDRLDKLVQDILECGYTIIYIDEVTQLVSYSYAPKMFTIVYTQGAAAGVGVWAGAQRPRNTPEVMRDQAEVWVVFRVKKYEDRMTISDYIPNSGELLAEALPPRFFIYYDDSMDGPILFSPLEIKENKVVDKPGAKVGR